MSRPFGRLSFPLPRGKATGISWMSQVINAGNKAMMEFVIYGVRVSGVTRERVESTRTDASNRFKV